MYTVGRLNLEMVQVICGREANFLIVFTIYLFDLPIR